jgi:apolipoprotein N-acyltransferase
MTIMEWVQYTFTPFASWGVAAYTQADNIALMQTVSLFGMAGLSFLIYWINIEITNTLTQQNTNRNSKLIPIAVLFILIVFGSFRYDLSKAKSVDTICVSAVGTDSEAGGLPLPSDKKNVQDKISLFNRTKESANKGAKIIVWNEAALYTLQKDEPEFISSITKLAIQSKSSLIASYIVLISLEPFKYENKYLFIDSTGSIVYTYHKHEPVPGEPSLKGKELLQVIKINETNVGGAICYDYDFPYLAQGFGKLNADIVVVPSSDWRGIDPLHTKMAAFRAIEQGHSIVRSTRFGMSAAISPYGEFINQMSSFDKNDKIMLANLPTKGVTTLYSILGDSFIYCCILFVLFFIFRSIRYGKLE